MTYVTLCESYSFAAVHYSNSARDPCQFHMTLGRLRQIASEIEATLGTSPDLSLVRSLGFSHKCPCFKKKKKKQGNKDKRVQLSAGDLK